MFNRIWFERLNWVATFGCDSKIVGLCTWHVWLPSVFTCSCFTTKIFLGSLRIRISKWLYKERFMQTWVTTCGSLDRENKSFPSHQASSSNLSYIFLYYQLAINILELPREILSNVFASNQPRSTWFPSSISLSPLRSLVSTCGSLGGARLLCVRGCLRSLAEGRVHFAEGVIRTDTILPTQLQSLIVRDSPPPSCGFYFYRYVGWPESMEWFSLFHGTTNQEKIDTTLSGHKPPNACP